MSKVWGLCFFYFALLGHPLAALAGNSHPLAVSVTQTSDSPKSSLATRPQHFMSLVYNPIRSLDPSGDYQSLPVLSYARQYSYASWGVFAGQQEARSLNQNIGRTLEQQTRILGAEFGLHNLLYQRTNSELVGHFKIQANMINQSWINTQLATLQNNYFNSWIGFSWSQKINQQLKIRTEIFMEEQGQLALGVGVLW